MENNCSPRQTSRPGGALIQPICFVPRLSVVPCAPWLYRLTYGAACLWEASECPWAEGPLEKGHRIGLPEEVEYLPHSPLGVSWFMSDV